MIQATPDSIRMDVHMAPHASAPHRLLADIKRKTLRSRLLSTLLGDKHEIVIIMPSQNVSNVTFTRQQEKAGAEK